MPRTSPDLDTTPAEPAARGVLLCSGAHLDDDREALSLARAIVRRRLPSGWRVRSLGSGARDYLAVPPTGRLKPARAWELARRLEADRDVLDAEPDLVVPGIGPDRALEGRLLTPAERRRKSSTDGAPLPAAAGDCAWSLTLTRAPEAWRLRPPAGGRARGEGILIAHPDTGYTRHPEIWAADPSRSRVFADAGRDFVDNDRDPTDPLVRGNPGHGTATASVIVSDTSNEVRPFVHGVAPLARVVPLRVTTRVVLFSYSRLAEALHYAAAAQFHVVSMSLGGVVASAALERAVQHAIDAGAVVLAAAGNVWPWVIYPARLPSVIAVAACNAARRPWSGSAHGEAVDVTAPGESVWRARPRGAGVDNDTVEMGSGTSYAVATTAGVAALWLAWHGRDRLIERYGDARHLAPVFKDVMTTAGVQTPRGWQRQEYGAGIVDAASLLSAPLPATPPAGGMKARGPRRIARHPLMDDLLAYVPDADGDAVVERVRTLLHADARALRGVLDELGPELLFQVATNPSVRQALAARPTQRPAIDAKTRSRSIAADPAFQRTASAGLRRRVATGR